MKEKRVFHALGSVNDKFIEEMYGPGEAKKNPVRHHTGKKMWLIAAVIATMVFLMGCAWVVVRIAQSPLFDYPLTESADVEAERIHLIVSDVTSASMHITCSVDGVDQVW